MVEQLQKIPELRSGIFLFNTFPKIALGTRPRRRERRLKRNSSGIFLFEFISS
jgi:hypothetical protein